MSRRTGSRQSGARRVGPRTLVAAVSGTTSSVMPAFLTGAVAVQLAGDLDLSDGQLGVAIGAFFASAAIGSMVLGRTAERLGASWSMRTGLALTVVTGLLLSRVSSAAMLTGILLIGGTSNALTQPAANLLLAERIATGRLGIAFAVKQAGMPLASLLGGLAVPLLALRSGWRSAYIAGAVLAALAALAIPSYPRRALADAAVGGGANRPDLSTRLLLLYGAAGLFGASAAGAAVTFLVTAAEGSGMSPSRAALLLTGGSLIGITSRLANGRWADGPGRRPIRRVGLLLGLGAVGLLIMALDTPVTYVVGVVPMFAFGWAWPGLFNLSVVRNNPSAPAAATGITQTGVYLGAGAGPAVGGLIADAFGYTGVWLAAAAGLALAAAATGLLVISLGTRRTQAPSADVAGGAPL